MQCVRFVAWLLRCVSAVPLSAQDGAGRRRTAHGGGEWRTHGDDTGSAKYSPLDQITADNFGGLVAFAQLERQLTDERVGALGRIGGKLGALLRSLSELMARLADLGAGTDRAEALGGLSNAPRRGAVLPLVS